ncbi:MAG TPA: hypothetical protein PLB38_03685, partial [bacterium]|nr:hypothetical protein [bacterium]
MMDPIQRTQDRLEQVSPSPPPVIPVVPKKDNSPIPGLEEGESITLRHGTTIPISIEVPGQGKTPAPKNNMILDIRAGISMHRLDNKLVIEPVPMKPLSFWRLPFLLL